MGTIHQKLFRREDWKAAHSAVFLTIFLNAESCKHIKKISSKFFGGTLMLVLKLPKHPSFANFSPEIMV